MSTDHKIIEALRNGEDENVIRHLYDSTFKKIRRFVLKNSGSDEDAEDIFQDAVLVFYDQVKKGKYRQETEIDGFIYGVSRNLWYKRFHKKSRVSTYEEYMGTEYVENNTYNYLFSEERDSIIMSAFEKLGERCKDLLINTIYNNMSMREICDLMGFSTENAAKTKHYKCKQRLIKLMDGNKELKELLQSGKHD